MNFKKALFGLALNIGVFFLCFLIIEIFSLEDSSALYKGLIHASAANVIYTIVNLFWIILNLSATASWIKSIFSEKIKEKHFRKFIETKGEILKENSSLQTLFKYTPKEIMIGEKVIKQNGDKLKNISKIKDEILRLCVEQGKDIFFTININDGTVYKMIKFLDKTYIFEISYQELNRCIEMKDDIHDKYKKITQDNWKSLCKKVK